MPVCAALDKIRPCTPAESMAYLYLHTDGPVVDYVPGPDDEQQNYMDNSRDIDKARNLSSARKKQRVNQWVYMLALSGIL